MKKIIFFGCPLDADERHESIQEKLALIGTHRTIEDPYEGIMEIVRHEMDPGLWSEIGSMELPSWLRPIPSLVDETRITTEAFVDFIDQGGYETYAHRVGDFIAENIFPNIPCMLAVDHSLTGGALKKLAELYEPETISLIILDSHTDALPMSVLSDTIQYDIESNPDTLYDRNDPFLYDRPDSYNASSFLYDLLAQEVINPHHLYILGISDYPSKSAFRIKDSRVENHVRIFSELKRQGVTLVTKKDLLISPSKIKHILSGIKTPYVYISIDMDIGARNGMEGVRFLERQGLNEKQIYRIVEALKDLLSHGVRLAGMDISEINPRKAGRPQSGGKDQTYQIAANIIKLLLK
jgi:arginase family enzyme